MNRSSSAKDYKALVSLILSLTRPPSVTWLHNLLFTFIKFTDPVLKYVEHLVREFEDYGMVVVPLVVMLGAAFLPSPTQEELHMMEQSLPLSPMAMD